MALLVAAALLVGAAFAIEELRWRVQIVAAKASGQFADIPFIDLVRWLRPGSPVHLSGLADTPAPHVVISNPINDAASAERGQAIFATTCASCHGGDAHGGTAPNLTQSVGAISAWNYFSTVRYGRPGTVMVAQALSEEQAWQVHAFLVREAERAARGGRAVDAAARNVTVSAEQLAAPLPGRDWPVYAGNFAGHRHSGLAQVNASNASRLALKWMYRLRSRAALAEGSPIVVDGVLYMSESMEGVVAIDAAAGSKLWQFQRPVPADLLLCCGGANRGVAIAGGTVFVSTLDAHVVALDASTGKQKWIARLADYRVGYSMSGAPLALADKVIVGVAGGDFGARGFIAALDNATGKELWRFSTVPEPGQPGSETWAGESWKLGGAATWATGSYDPAADLVFWGVGNPAPSLDARARGGDNLYSNSVIAVNATTGKLAWHYQFIAGDDRDWDSTQQPILGSIAWEGKPVDAVLFANRNGFFYALERRSGRFLFARPFATQSWNDGFDASGRPKVKPDAHPSMKGTLIWPYSGGATNWWPPSYDAGRQLVLVPTVDAASIYYRSEARHQAGREYLGSVSQHASSHPATAAVRAIDARTGEVRFEALLERGGPEVMRIVGGVLSTAGGVFFVGYREQFAAFDSENGRRLWTVSLGARIHAPPVAFTVGGEQRVAVAAGDSLFVFGLP